MSKKLTVGVYVTENTVQVRAYGHVLDVILFDERTYNNIKGSEHRERMRDELHTILDMDINLTRPRVKDATP
jgi:hypothetical protein